DEKLYSMIFPGTKWCGPGNNADGYDDLGKFRETDKCCRDHDNCDSIPAGGEKHGLQNDGRYTRLHCKCDKNFYDCLHKVNDRVSNIVGRTYFQFTNLCYREDRPTTGCLETETSLFDKRCVKYSYDRSQPKKYQWFDLPYYNSEKFPDLRGSEAETY
ncbi:phospholipase A2-like, partial [Condylostylus longicornis]|uniref:phospholipase A2-like n=1 Tax=Condylostylus longicornis TaxID=2530218 RepID=UPI00244DD1A6